MKLLKQFFAWLSSFFNRKQKQDKKQILEQVTKKQISPIAFKPAQGGKGYYQKVPAIDLTYRSV